MEGIVSQFAGIYREWAPHASLRGHVRCLWINDLSGSRSECVQVVPDGCVDIVWTGETLCIAGPDTRPILARMPCGAIVVGVRFHPGAASAWLGQPLGEIVNVRVLITVLPQNNMSSKCSITFFNTTAQTEHSDSNSQLQPRRLPSVTPHFCDEK